MRISDSETDGHHLLIGVNFAFETEQQHPVSSPTRYAKKAARRGR